MGVDNCVILTVDVCTIFSTTILSHQDDGLLRLILSDAQFLKLL